MNFLKFRASIFGCLSAVICLSIFLTSCEKTEDVVKMQTEEDNINITDNDSKISIDDNIEVLEPVLHMRISDDLTEEEANTQWEAKVNEYLSQQKLVKSELTERGGSTILYSKVEIKTGNSERAGTYGRVDLKLKFKTNLGYRFGKFELDHSANDRQIGSRDFYLVGVKMPEPQWAHLVWAELSLKGTDDWLIDIILIDVLPQLSGRHVGGKSYIHVGPNYWLWNYKENQVDIYRTHESYGKGLIFWTI